MAKVSERLKEALEEIGNEKEVPDKYYLSELVSVLLEIIEELEKPEPIEC
jgi:hypothetical protein